MGRQRQLTDPDSNDSTIAALDGLTIGVSADDSEPIEG